MLLSIKTNIYKELILNAYIQFAKRKERELTEESGIYC